EQPVQMREDIIHAVSAHWKRTRLNNREPYPVEAGAETSLSCEAFRDWLQRMSFRKGDGLAFLGEFFENNGHFELALACYEGACDRYATLPDGKKERRLLHTEFRIPFCLAFTGREEEAAEKQLAFIQSLEKQQLREQYPDVYASALLETAGRLVRSGQLAEGKKLWQKADRFSDEHRILHGKVYAESVQGAILYREGKVREASEHFLNALNGSSILGLAYGEARAAIDAAHCARDLGDRFHALKWSGMAQYAAQKSGDRVLQQYIEHDRQDIRAYFDFNHRIRQQSRDWETAFTALLNRVGVSFRRFRFLLASRDQKALDELFAALEQLPGPDAGQSAALSWFRIMAAFECGQRDAAQAMLRALSDFTGNCPLLELELYYQRHDNETRTSSDWATASASALEMAELGLLETRSPILRLKLELEGALAGLCRERGIEFSELMALFEQMKVEKAGALLDQLSEALPHPRPGEGMSMQEAAIRWHRSLLHRRKSGETRQELQVLEKLIEAFPDNPVFRYNAGVAL
ncbi:MAG TPA: hypothetical protein PLW66_15670, partial [Saprospiraceae bacterium]|nr:hypothetical protein [Saprospiraceae bacterium]